MDSCCNVMCRVSSLTLLAVAEDVSVAAGVLASLGQLFARDGDVALCRHPNPESVPLRLLIIVALEFIHVHVRWCLEGETVVLHVVQEVADVWREVEGRVLFDVLERGRDGHSNRC